MTTSAIIQTIIAVALLIVAVYYVVRTFYKSMDHSNHDCPDCGVSAKPGGKIPIPKAFGTKSPISNFKNKL